MSSKGSIKRRNRIEGQVYRAAQLSTQAAAFVASVGGVEDSDQPLVGMLVRCYVALEAECKKDPAAKQDFRKVQKSISKYFLQAIENRNVGAIRCIADEIEKCRREPNLLGEKWLLFLGEKARIEKTGDNVTVNDFKDYFGLLYEKSKYICRRLNIRTVSDKVGRKKIRENKVFKKA